MVRFLSRGGGDITKELKERSSYVRLLAMGWALSTIVPSYVIYVKRPHKFLRTVRALHETSSRPYMMFEA